MGLMIDGVAASSALDTSGEIVDIRGMDITSLAVSGTINFEHKSDLPAQTVGKILKAKKILKSSDCSNDREKYFWAKCELPFVYIVAELFDDYTESAKHLAGIFKYDEDNRTKHEKNVLSFSVEGAKIPGAIDGMHIKRSIARKVTVTVQPANHTAIAEKMPGAKSDDDGFGTMFKSESGFEIEMLKSEEILALLNSDNYVEKLNKAAINHPPQAIGTTKSGKTVNSHGLIHESAHFTSADHRDAAELHRSVGRSYQDTNIRSHHNQKADLHLQAANSAEKREQKAKNFKPPEKKAEVPKTEVPKNEAPKIEPQKTRIGPNIETSVLRPYAQVQDKKPLVQKSEMNKAISAGMPTAPGSNVQGAALQASEEYNPDGTGRAKRLELMKARIAKKKAIKKLAADELDKSAKPGLWANIHAKQKRIEHGSKEHMRSKKSSKAPSKQDFIESESGVKKSEDSPASSIGTTRSGKHIMSHADHPAHAGFTMGDHEDAFRAHDNAATSAGGVASNHHLAQRDIHEKSAFPTNPGKFKDRKAYVEHTRRDKAVDVAGNKHDLDPSPKNHQALVGAMDHRDAHIAATPGLKEHLDQSKAHRTAKFGPLKKSEDSPASSIGTTRSGKHIMSHADHPAHADYSKADHNDAAAMHNHIGEQMDKEHSNGVFGGTESHSDPLIASRYNHHYAQETAHKSLGSKSRASTGLPKSFKAAKAGQSAAAKKDADTASRMKKSELLERAKEEFKVWSKREFGKTEIEKSETLHKARSIVTAFKTSSSKSLQSNRPLGKSEDIDELKQNEALVKKFDPRKELDHEGAKAMSEWVGGNTGQGIGDKTRSEIPEASPKAKKRITQKLMSRTQWKKAPDGKREFLLHRHMSSPELESNTKNGKINQKIHSSWSPDKEFAKNGVYGRESFDSSDNQSYSRIASAWVHEDNIHTAPRQYGEHGTNEPGQLGPAHQSEEQEIIVKPKHNSELHSVLRNDSPTKYDWKPDNSYAPKPKKLVKPESFKKGEKVIGNRQVAKKDAETASRMKKSELLERAKEEFKVWSKREAFMAFMKESKPSMTKSEAIAYGQTVALKEAFAAEEALGKLAKVLTFGDGKPAAKISPENDATPKPLPKEFRDHKKPVKGVEHTEVAHVQPHYDGKSPDTVYTKAGHQLEGHPKGKFKAGDKVTAKSFIMNTHTLEHGHND